MPYATIRELREKYLLAELDKREFIERAGETHAVLFSYAELLSCSDVREIRIGADGVLFQVGSDGLLFSCPKSETRVAPLEALNFGFYEPAETKLMLDLIGDKSVVFDVGANIGWFALIFAKRIPGCEGHAFEPVPVFHEHLNLNIARNALQSNVLAYSTGFSDARQSVTMYFDPGNGTNASLLNVSQSSTVDTVAAEMYAMDDWCAERDVWPDVIKCDVEGAELLVLRGAAEVLDRNKPLIFLEMLRKWSKPFGYHPNDIISFLDERGYTCYAVTGEGLKVCQFVDESTLETNYLFLNRSNHSELFKRLDI